MTCRARSDLSINLPALRKLDDMLLDILDSFQDQGYWYIDQEIFTQNCDDLGSFRKYLRRQEDKWWLPIPCVPKNGLPENSRKKLLRKRDCANQIMKAAKSINDHALAEMEVPQSFLSSLPKNGRECLGDAMHSFVISDQFSDDCLLGALEFFTEHEVLEVANRLEASIFMWQHKNMKKERKIFIGTEKAYRFAKRSRNLLIRLKQKFPSLTHTALDLSKTKFNKDVGKSILESYSRVLEHIALNIIARIDDLLYVDGLARKPDPFSSVQLINDATQKHHENALTCSNSPHDFAKSFTHHSDFAKLFTHLPLTRPTNISKPPTPNSTNSSAICLNRNHSITHLIPNPSAIFLKPQIPNSTSPKS